MPNKLITDLTLRSDFDATCNVPVEDGVQTWRSTGAQILAYIKAQYLGKRTIYRAAATGTYTSSDNGSAVLSKSIPAGTYRFTISGFMDCASASNCAATMRAGGSTFYPLGGSTYQNRAHLVQVAGSGAAQTLTFIYTVGSTTTFDLTLSLTGASVIGTMSWTAEKISTDDEIL